LVRGSASSCGARASGARAAPLFWLGDLTAPGLAALHLDPIGPVSEKLGR